MKNMIDMNIYHVHKNMFHGNFVEIIHEKYMDYFEIDHIWKMVDFECMVSMIFCVEICHVLSCNIFVNSFILRI